ncbi:hypothetical protein A0H81_03421 [Grifola frondosa]|uniref:Uncharacterized protein n=1 Tax=Grifola frondosa TaxID=5627 RepID=A0A1C7MJI8_GRIFR|nr:hypothetical protein A0H81_03421 [Grifola frondosa]
MGLSSALIALRIIGIWGPSLQVILSVSTVFLVNVGFILYGIIRNGGSEWSNTEKICVDIDTTRNNINIFVAFATDTIMLFMMLFGIWWNRAGAGSLWQLIKRQGVIWLTVSVLFYIPVVVIASLNLNDAMNLLFQLPLCMAMTICSTRMYRSLYEYTNPGQFTIHASEPLNFAAGANTSQSESGANGGTFGDVTLMVQTEKTARNDVKTTASVYAQV